MECRALLYYLAASSEFVLCTIIICPMSELCFLSKIKRRDKIYLFHETLKNRHNNHHISRRPNHNLYFMV